MTKKVSQMFFLLPVCKDQRQLFRWT